MFQWLKKRTHSAPRIYEGNPAGSLTAASAALISRASRDIRKLTKAQGWQETAWQYYDIITELHTGANWLATAVSRATLQVAQADDGHEGEPTVVDDPKIQDVLDGFFNGQVGQSEMLRRTTLHLTIPGETWICGWETPEGIEWRAATASELRTSKANMAIVPNFGETPVELTTENSTVFRIWRPHARNGIEADSPTRSVLPICKEIQGYAEHINATTESRLAGAGMLVVPASVTSTSPGAGEGVDTTGDAFMDTLMESMIIPVSNRESAGALVPIMARVPDGASENIRHINFSTPYDERIQDLREAAIKRLAVGMDMPIEILLGISESNHWTAWQVDETAIKLHVEPMLTLICSAITEQYLRPALADLVPNPDDYMVWFDTAALVQRPNKGPEARELYDRDELSAAALLRENGFNEDDAPDEQERQRRLLTRLLLASPDLASQLLPQLGAPPVSAPAQQIEAQPAPQPQVEPVSPQDQRPEPPQQDLIAAQVRAYREDHSRELLEWQLNVAEVSALRALEYAGKWLMGRAGRNLRPSLMHINPAELHTVIPHTALKESAKDERGQIRYDQMLENAFTALDMTLPETPCMKNAIDTYVRGLVKSGRKHSREQLADVLSIAGCVGGCDD